MSQCLVNISFLNFQLINDILARDRLPVIVGGTNYYIQVRTGQIFRIFMFVIFGNFYNAQ